MEERSQGGALSPRGDVAGSKIRDRGAAGALGDDRRIPDLKGGSVFRMVGDRLTMGSDRDPRKFTIRDAGLGRHRKGGPGEAFAQEYIESSQFLESLLPGNPARGEGVNPPLQLGLEGLLEEGEKLPGRRFGGVRPRHQRRIHGVCRSTGHEPDHEHVFPPSPTV